MINSTTLNSATAYAGYAYSYPHKTAYRQLEPPMPLSEIWKNEDRTNLFLYIHIPFCEMRCGFCNLFTIAHPRADLERLYVETVERQAAIVRESIGKVTIARMAIGGGTPTFLEANLLDRLLASTGKAFEFGATHIPTSVETSPLTSQDDRLAVLRRHNVDRISIGVQSFDEAEVNAVGRSQKNRDVHHALELIRAHDFPVLNIDLIYGLPGQSKASLLRSLEEALAYSPEEIYLYPLYVRPLTGLGKQQRQWEDLRSELYRSGRDFLHSRGYQQISMRMFQAPHAPPVEGPTYCCQRDGMIGLGAGARSYARNVHYSTRYAVAPDKIRGIIDDYIDTDDNAFRTASWGIQLRQDDRARRFVIQSILQAEGLSISQYEQEFGSDIFETFSALKNFERDGLISRDGDRFILTKHGYELADLVGHSLYSEEVKELMRTYETV